MILHKGKKLVFKILLVLSVLAFTGCSNNAETDDTPVTLSAPQNISVTESATVNCVTVSCDAIDYDSAHHYIFYYSTTNDTGTSSYASTEFSRWIKNGRISCDISLPESGTYYFWVKAVADVGNAASDLSEASEPFEFTLKVLDAPTDVKATVSSEKLNTVTVTWNAINCDKEHYYWIYWSKTNDTSLLETPNYYFYKSSSIKNGVGSYDVTLSESGTYYFWVKAASGYYSSTTTSSDFSEASDPVSFTVKTLDAPTDVKATESSSKANTVTVTWNAIDCDEEHYYWIYWSKTNDTSLLKTPNYYYYRSSSIQDGVGSYDVSLLESGTYYFWVKAAADYPYRTPTSSDFSAASEPVSFTFKTLDAPTDVKATVSSSKANAVTVTWKAIDCDIGHYYWIYWSKINDTSLLETPNYYLYKSSSISEGIGSYDVSFSESGTYYFWVKAASGYYSSTTTSSDFSEASDPVSFTVKTLDAPTDVKATESSSKANTVTVTWNAIDCDEEHYYWIYWSKTNDTSLLKTPNYYYYCSSSIQDGVGSYDVSLSESGTYYFWVKAASDYYSSTTTSSDFSSVASFDFTHTELTAPAGLKVSSFSSDIYPLKLEWTSTKAPYYHVYMNTENNSETASLNSSYNTSNYALISASKLTAGTTYYFWVKSADTSSNDSPTSAFSEVCSYEWTGQ